MSRPQKLTHDGKRKEDLSWSSDGKRLACSCYVQPGRIAVATMDPDGGNLRVLSQDPVERAPAWSHDGARIAFVHVTQSGTDGELDLYSMKSDGSDRRPLVAERKVFENFPSWSPDGTRLLYTTTRDKSQEIYCAGADGSDPKRLTSDPSLKQYPRWSPDGKLVVYNANREGSFDIFVMRADGSETRRLTDHPSSDVSPAWSPDGHRIAWVSYRDGNPEIYVMNADGSEPRNVSQHPGYDFSPAWMPDGKTLTWVSDREGKLDVFGVAM